MMDARRIDGLLQRHAVIDDIDDDFQHRGDDARAARRSEHENRLAILEHDGRRHGAQGPLAGRDRIGFALNQTETVCDARLGGEVIHFVVQKEPGIAGDHFGPERIIDGVSDRDCVAQAIDHGIVRRGGVLVARPRAPASAEEGVARFG